MTRGRVLASIVAAILLSIGTASPVGAADEIGVSIDGTTWSPRLSEPLFDPAVRWVPGDRRTATFYIRNQTDDDAVLALDLIATDSEGLLVTDAITVTGTVAGAPMATVDPSGTHRLIADADLRANAVAEVELTIGFDPSATDRTQATGFEFDLRAELVERVGDPPGDVTTTTTTVPATIPITGGALVGPIIGAGAFLLTIGAFAVTTTRRRRA